MFLWAFIYLFVCGHDYFKSNEQIWYYMRVRSCQRKKNEILGNDQDQKFSETLSGGGLHSTSVL